MLLVESRQFCLQALYGLAVRHARVRVEVEGEPPLNIKAREGGIIEGCERSQEIECKVGVGGQVL